MINLQKVIDKIKDEWVDNVSNMEAIKELLNAMIKDLNKCIIEMEHVKGDLDNEWQEENTNGKIEITHYYMSELQKMVEKLQ